ncbi:MAG: DNA-formamidopyrimidine glycosylase family protein [Acidimicrobiales bacterium]
MPEGLEVEYYRRLADTAVGRRIGAVEAPDAWYLKGGVGPGAVVAALEGRRVTGTRRIGKLLLVDTDGPTLGLRFGMTGRLLVDDTAAIEHLEYSSRREDPTWDRFVLRFGTTRRPAGDLRMRDPRRLGAVELEPATDRLGVDLFDVTPRALAAVLAGSSAPLKARLLDQSRVAGLGNLLVDEILWRARLAPDRPAGSLDAAEQRRLQRTIRTTVRQLLERGGSHTGDLMVARVRGGTCPRCGTPLARQTVGGRTTYWCRSCVGRAR